VLDLLDRHWEKMDNVRDSDVLATLRKCVERLTQHARRIIGMRYVDGMQSAEVAQQLGINVSSVYVSLMRIHRTLAECVAREKQREGEAGR